MTKKDKKFYAIIAIIAFAMYVVRPMFPLGDSMNPTISRGDIGIGICIYNSLDRDDIVATKRFNDWATEDGEFMMSYLKRIVGVPGDTISVRGFNVTVNGELVTVGARTLTTKNNHDYVLEEDEYFLLGDNYDDSYDSRVRGPFPGSQIACKIIGNLHFY